MKYTPLPIRMDLTEVAMQEAAHRLGPAFVYELHVRDSMVVHARGFMKKMNADTQGNPFAPYVNIATDNDLSTNEWYVTANQNSVGSKGYP
jgi:hypothetical protein